MLKLENITKDYTTNGNTVNVLKGITLGFRKSEFVSILGHSGCGKTTLLNLIGGLDRCTSGRVIIDGRSTEDYTDIDWNDYRNKRIGFVFQSYNLIPHLTIQKNVELSLTLAGISKEERSSRALDVLNKVGLLDHAKKRPNQLSGGQMQRVAIARALVNNPEIILADEPTGALDSESGIEVMNILKEIASDRLVIMVTHNSQLAESYSTRIITMSDGEITGDSNEYSIDELTKDEQAIATEDNTDAKSKKKKRQKSKASMSPLTAFSLSFTNLISKKGRTFLTSFAGSIGIIGIMLVLALSNGASMFIKTLEENALSQYPIEINETSADLSSILQILSESSEDREAYPDTDTIYTNKVIGNLLEKKDNLVSNNDLTKLKDYIDKNFDEDIGYVKYNYGTSFDVYCNYSVSASEADSYYAKVQPFLDAIEDIPALSSFASQLSSFSSYLTVWDEMTDNTDLLKQQYELIGNSKWPTNYNEVVLVVDDKNQLNDYLLFALGLKSKDDIVGALLGDDSFSSSTFTVDEIINNLTYRVCTSSDYYYKDGDEWQMVTGRDNQRAVSFVEGQTNGRDNTVEIKVVGVIRPKEGVEVTSINGNIGYTSALSTYLTERAKTSPIVVAQMENELEDVYSGDTFDSDSEYTERLRELGVVDLNCPTSIQIYANSFDDKENIIAFLEQYKTDTGEDLKYTDTLSMIMGYVDTMTSTITGVLVGFAAISLIVSSIMIAIIIYTSVIERKKEIGVLRSIGARKRDVSGVFIAESGIIGCFSGVIGIALAYLIMVPINLILNSLFGVSNLASPAWWQPLMMFFISIVLSVLAGFIPSRIAANKDPVECLRSE